MKAKKNKIPAALSKAQPEATCPQRLIAVFENIADGVTNLFFDNNVCQKHLLAVHKERQVLYDKNYVSPRKVRTLYSANCN